MDMQVDRQYLGIDLTLVLAATGGDLDRHRARLEPVLARAAQRCAEILAVAERDVTIAAVTMALRDRGILTTRVAFDDRGELEVTYAGEVSDDRRAEGDALVRELQSKE